MDHATVIPTLAEAPVSTAFRGVQASRPANRFNIYQAVHKGLRAFMSDTLNRVGSTDPNDPEECEQTATQVRSLLFICTQHLQHENDFIHTAMERRCAGSAARGAHEHDAHVAHIASLSACLAHAVQAQADEQALAWQQLYHALSLFVAENFEHMLLEEREHNAVLWRHYSDEELQAIHGALVASLPPDEMALNFRWMLPQLSHPERVGMLMGMREGMPAQAFAARLHAAQALLGARAWAKLDAALQGGAHHG